MDFFEYFQAFDWLTKLTDLDKVIKIWIENSKPIFEYIPR